MNNFINIANFILIPFNQSIFVDVNQKKKTKNSPTELLEIENCTIKQ